jgi:hypothetical protein
LPTRGQIAQLAFKLSAASSDRLLIKSGNLSQLAITRTFWLLGQHPGIPASLGFIQPAEQQVHLMMILRCSWIVSCLTYSTLALMDLLFWFVCHSQATFLELAYIIP